jgi:iron complex transport system substrate-binding protein
MPDLRRQPLFIKPGTEMNFETLAKSKPDVLLVHAGCCTINWRAGDDQKMNSTLGKLRSLGIPTVVLHGPNFSGRPDMAALSDNLRILGQVFGREESAQKLASFLESEVKRVSDRTKGIAEARKPRVLLFGLNPNVRRSGGSGTAVGRRDIQSYMLEEVVHARNAFPDDSFSKDLNTEQVLALDPDVFVLPTSNGYHPPRELYGTQDFANLGILKAIRERRISALPWSPCNCDQRLEYPVHVMVMAQAAYPQLFSDIDLEDWMVRFFRNVYRVDDRTANGLIDALWMNWARDQSKSELGPPDPDWQ